MKKTTKKRTRNKVVKFSTISHADVLAFVIFICVVIAVLVSVGNVSRYGFWSMTAQVGDSVVQSPNTLDTFSGAAVIPNQPIVPPPGTAQGSVGGNVPATPDTVLPPPLLPDSTAPTTPTELRALNMTPTSFTLAWRESVDADVSGQIKSGVRGYRIFKDDDATAFLYSSVNYIHINGLAPGTAHRFSVAAFDARENASSQSSRLLVTLSNSTTAASIPNSTTGTIGVAGTSRTVTTPNLSSVNRDTTTVVPTPPPVINSLPVRDTTITVPLSPDTTAPTTPTELRAYSSALGEVMLAWRASYDPDVRGQVKSGVRSYRVYKDDETAPIAYSSTPTVRISGLKPGATYRFAVYAVDAKENLSGVSNPVVVTVAEKFSSTGAAQTIPNTVSGVNSTQGSIPNIPNQNQVPSTQTLRSTQTPVPTPRPTVALKPMLVIPATGRVFVGEELNFIAQDKTTGETLRQVEWGITEARGGSINRSGIYVPPTVPGLYHVLAQVPGYITGKATVQVREKEKPRETPSAIPDQTSSQSGIGTSGSHPAGDTHFSIEEKPVESSAVNPNSSEANPTPEEMAKAPRVADRVILPVRVERQFESEVSKTWTEKLPAPTVEVVKKIQHVNSTISAIKESADEHKKKLVSVIDEHIAKRASSAGSGDVVDRKAIEAVREEIVEELDSQLGNPTAITPERVHELEVKMNEGLKKIDELSPRAPASVLATKDSARAVDTILNTFSTKVEAESKAFKEQGGDLLYKDSNRDGISDYEAVHLYNMDPVAPTPVTEFLGLKITAQEKALFGFDPTQKGFVKVVPEEPTASVIPPTPTYEVKEVQITEEKNVVIKGRALPNSLITVYIYSTPIVVVVKTNDSGEWEYTLDRELESGDHKIYTASVNNSGKIVAKSAEFSFTKPAEAATLTSVVAPQVTPSQKPGILSAQNLYIILGIFTVIVLASVAFIGLKSKGQLAQQSSAEAEGEPRV